MNFSTRNISTNKRRQAECGCNDIGALTLTLIFRRYADEHLLTEIQDPRSDDELDSSGILYMSMNIFVPPS